MDSIDRAEAHQRTLFERYLVLRREARTTGSADTVRASREAYATFLSSFLSPSEQAVERDLIERGMLRHDEYGRPMQ